eukprot:gnl/MRDRNA2_/MRDRNA2_128099_c0_seq1.p1 gnl/MRDRNA2_/MRDRNA2_128099_c0~~gnl/MRDRNA2_/MRDRNA2_128099_c0_seq1.p1  ORF type:complete len:145 (-),score=23.56 gnl/MRDRNA2_/MRDRNA2_128099_c0_seq1:950-1336(-)
MSFHSDGKCSSVATPPRLCISFQDESPTTTCSSPCSPKFGQVNQDELFQTVIAHHRKTKEMLEKVQREYDEKSHECKVIESTPVERTCQGPQKEKKRIRYRSMNFLQPGASRTGKGAPRPSRKSTSQA